MILIEDIASNQEPATANCSHAPEAPAPTRPMRGHTAKILDAVTALRAAGRLPPNMRPKHRNAQIIAWLKKAGFGEDLPDRNAIRRAFRRLGLK